MLFAEMERRGSQDSYPELLLLSVGKVSLQTASAWGRARPG